MKNVWNLVGLFMFMTGLIMSVGTAVGSDGCIYSDEGCDDDQEEIVSNNSGVLHKYMKVTSPDILSEAIGKNSMVGENVHTITWNSPALVKYVNLLYSVDGGINYTEIAVNIENTGSYEWILPEINSEYVLV